MLNKLFESSRRTKRSISVLVDALAIITAFYSSMSIRLGTLHPPLGSSEALLVCITIVLSLTLFVRLGMYRAILRYMSSHAMLTILACACASGLILTAASFFTHSTTPRSVPFIYSLLLLFFIGAPRLLVHSVVITLSKHAIDNKENVAIYGAGYTGHQLALALTASNYKVVAFLDDNRRLRGTVIAGVKTYSPSSIGALITGKKISKVLLALGNTSHSRRASIIKMVESHSVIVLSVSTIYYFLCYNSRSDQR